MHRLKIISNITPNIKEYANEVAGHEYYHYQLKGLEGISYVNQRHNFIFVFILIIVIFILARRIFQLLLRLMFNYIHKCLGVKQFNWLGNSDTLNEIKEPAILKVKQRSKRKERHQVKYHGGFYVAHRGFWQLSHWIIGVLILVLEKELENKVQKINGFNNVGYIIVYYQLFFLDTMDFELALYYIRLLQFDRLQPRLSHLL